MLGATDCKRTNPFSWWWVYSFLACNNLDKLNVATTDESEGMLVDERSLGTIVSLGPPDDKRQNRNEVNRTYISLFNLKLKKNTVIKNNSVWSAQVISWSKYLSTNHGMQCSAVVWEKIKWPMQKARSAIKCKQSWQKSKAKVTQKNSYLG